MPGNEPEGQEAVDLPETVTGAPAWGGVPRAGGDHADATAGQATETDVSPEPAANAGEDATDAGEDPEAPQAEADSSAEVDGEE